MQKSVRQQLRRAAQLGVLALALSAGAGHVAGCIYPDYCIEIGIAGTEACQRFTNATGTTPEGEVLMLSEDFNPLEGCSCLRDGELAILKSEDPDMPGYMELYEELQTAARQACLDRVLELGMVDSNCLVADIEGVIDQNEVHSCTAGCVYSNPPPNRRCPECVVGDENASGETGASTGAAAEESESGDEPPGRVQLLYGGTP